VTLDDAAVVVPSPAPYPTPKATTADAPHAAIGVLRLRFVTVVNCTC